MKKLMTYTVMTLLVLSVSTLSAQKLVAESGNLKFLEGQSEIKFEYDFKDMDVGKEGTEAEYTGKKVAEMNKKKAGTGDEWLMKWNNDKMATYQPAFEMSFNAILQKFGMKGSMGASDAKYTCVVKTMSLYPGIYVGFQIPAYVSYNFVFHETGKPQNVVAKFTLKKVEGEAQSRYSFDVPSRVKVSYGKAARVLAKAMIKQIPLKKKK